MHYRMLTLLLISIMFFGLNGMVAQAATTTEACSISGTFTITDNIVTNHDSCTGTATIPAEVTSIGESAFYEANSLTAITIPAGVTSIGWGAFHSASSLATVTFAAGSQLTSIGNSAFENASALTTITIPVGVTSIGNYAF